MVLDSNTTSFIECKALAGIPLHVHTYMQNAERTVRAACTQGRNVACICPLLNNDMLLPVHVRGVAKANSTRTRTILVQQ